MSLHVRNSFSPTSRSTQNSQDALPSSRPPTYNSFDDPQPVSSVTSRDNGSAYGDASLRNAVNGVLRDAGSPQGGTRSRLNHRQSMLTISARDPSALLDPRYRKHLLLTSETYLTKRTYTGSLLSSLHGKRGDAVETSDK